MCRSNHGGMGQYIEDSIAIESGFLTECNGLGDGLHPYGYMPDGSTFNGIQNILPDDYFHSLQLGDLLDNEDVNPLIWRK